MSNMSYCRHQNTLGDLQDCASDLEERMDTSVDEPMEPLSDDERHARKRLFETMAMMFEQLGVSVDIEEAISALEEYK